LRAGRSAALLHNVILGIHVLISLGLIGTVVMQSGKSAGLGTIGGAAESVFGHKKGMDDLLSRATTILSVGFMITSITLTVMTQ
jgi:preprotein translocase subunit SecG